MSPPPLLLAMSTVDYDVKLMMSSMPLRIGFVSIRREVGGDPWIARSIARKNTYTDFLHNETVVVVGAGGHPGRHSERGRRNGGVAAGRSVIPLQSGLDALRLGVGRCTARGAASVDNEYDRPTVRA